MTAIRKSGLQYVHFQCFTSKTTKIGYSNDRFGFKRTVQKGKCSMGWFFGLKLHLICNKRVKLLKFMITPSN